MFLNKSLLEKAKLIITEASEEDSTLDDKVVDDEKPEEDKPTDDQKEEKKEDESENSEGEDDTLGNTEKNDDENVNDDNKQIINYDDVKLAEIYDNFIEMRNMYEKIYNNFASFEFKSEQNCKSIYNQIQKYIQIINKILNTNFDKNKLSEYVKLYNKYINYLEIFNSLLDDIKNDNDDNIK